MDQTVLVGPDVVAGQRVVELLEQNGFPLSSAFWNFIEAASAWRLVIASPVVDEVNPRTAYALLGKLLRRGRGVVPMHDISLLSPNDPLVRSLASKYTITRDDPGSWAIGVAIDGHYIDGAYIYRSGATPYQVSYKGFIIEIMFEDDASRRADVAWVHVDHGEASVFKVEVIAPTRLFRDWGIHANHVARAEAAAEGVALARRLIDEQAFVREQTHCRLLTRDSQTEEITAAECPAT